MQLLRNEVDFGKEVYQIDLLRRLLSSTADSKIQLERVKIQDCGELSLFGNSASSFTISLSGPGSGSGRHVIYKRECLNGKLHNSPILLFSATES